MEETAGLDLEGVKTLKGITSKLVAMRKLKKVVHNIGKIEIIGNSAICFVDSEKLYRYLKKSGNTLNISGNQIPLVVNFGEISFPSFINIIHENGEKINFEFYGCKFYDEINISAGKNGSVILSENEYLANNRLKKLRLQDEKAFYSIEASKVVLIDEKIISEKCNKDNNVCMLIRKTNGDSRTEFYNATVGINELNINTGTFVFDDSLIKAKYMNLDCDKMVREGNSSVVSKEVMICEKDDNPEHLRNVSASSFLYNRALFRNTPLSEKSIEQYRKRPYSTCDNNDLKLYTDSSKGKIRKLCL